MRGALALVLLALGCQSAIPIGTTAPVAPQRTAQPCLRAGRDIHLSIWTNGNRNGLEWQCWLDARSAPQASTAQRGNDQQIEGGRGATGTLALPGASPPTPTARPP